MLVSVQLTIPAGFAVQKNGVCELVHGGTWEPVGKQVFSNCYVSGRTLDRISCSLLLGPHSGTARH